VITEPPLFCKRFVTRVSAAPPQHRTLARVPRRGDEVQCPSTKGLSRVVLSYYEAQISIWKLHGFSNWDAAALVAAWKVAILTMP
jgi:hypothetical protein